MDLSSSMVILGASPDTSRSFGAEMVADTQTHASMITAARVASMKRFMKVVLY